MRWYPLNGLPKLMLDHGELAQEALLTLRRYLNEKLIGFNLLPDKFTTAVYRGGQPGTVPVPFPPRQTDAAAELTASAGIGPLWVRLILPPDRAVHLVP